MKEPIQIETTDYRFQTMAFSILLKELNEVKISKVTGELIDSTPLTSIDKELILNTFNFNQSKEIPGFTAYLKAGINLLAQMKPNAQLDNELTAINEIVAEFVSSVYDKQLPQISYSFKQRQFVINDNGLRSLDAALIRLEGEQAITYQMFVDLHKRLASQLTQTSSVSKFLNSNYYQSGYEKIDSEELARLIKYHSKS